MVLPDRIRLSITPDWSYYNSFFPENERDYWEEHSKRVSTLMRVAREKKFKIERKQGKPYISTHQYYPFIGHVQVSPFRLNAVQVEFNFIRYLNSELHGLFINSESFERIKINENNYTLHDPDKVREFYVSHVHRVPYLASCAAQRAMKDLGEFLQYDNVTIKNIEFNKDFYVGADNSLDVMNRLSHYLQSDGGRAWRLRVLGQLSSHVTESALDVEQSSRTLSVRFALAKGLVVKFYNKTTDHVRCELIYFNRYIKKNYRRTSYLAIINDLHEHASNLIESLKVEKVLLFPLELDDYSVKERCMDVLETVKPGMSEILEAQLYTGVVSTPEGIACIRSYPDFKNLFYLSTDYYGNKIYIYNPVEAKRRREERIQVKRVYNHKDRFSE